MMRERSRWFSGSLGCVSPGFSLWRSGNDAKRRLQQAGRSRSNCLRIPGTGFPCTNEIGCLATIHPDYEKYVYQSYLRVCSSAGSHFYWALILHTDHTGSPLKNALWLTTEYGNARKESTAYSTNPTQGRKVERKVFISWRPISTLQEASITLYIQPRMIRNRLPLPLLVA